MQDFFRQQYYDNYGTENIRKIGQLEIFCKDFFWGGLLGEKNSLLQWRNAQNMYGGMHHQISLRKYSKKTPPSNLSEYNVHFFPKKTSKMDTWKTKVQFDQIPFFFREKGPPRNFWSKVLHWLPNGKTNMAGCKMDHE